MLGYPGSRILMVHPQVLLSVHLNVLVPAQCQLLPVPQQQQLLPPPTLLHLQVPAQQHPLNLPHFHTFTILNHLNPLLKDLMYP